MLKEYQRKGIGKLLFEAIIKDLINKGIFSMTVLC
ncbi:GNAT family N-acetyltransferase [Bacillus massiliglaciei]|nr:GNAT family N-acetyltransferase [Bacillus massiliglaciei]